MRRCEVLLLAFRADFPEPRRPGRGPLQAPVAPQRVLKDWEQRREVGLVTNVLDVLNHG